MKREIRRNLLTLRTLSPGSARFTSDALRSHARNFITEIYIVNVEEPAPTPISDNPFGRAAFPIFYLNFIRFHSDRSRD